MLHSLEDLRFDPPVLLEQVLAEKLQNEEPSSIDSVQNALEPFLLQIEPMKRLRSVQFHQLDIPSRPSVPRVLPHGSEGQAGEVRVLDGLKLREQEAQFLIRLNHLDDNRRNRLLLQRPHVVHLSNHDLLIIKPLLHINPGPHLLLLLDEPMDLIDLPLVHSVHQIRELLLVHLRLKGATHQVVLEHY